MKESNRKKRAARFIQNEYGRPDDAFACLSKPARKNKEIKEEVTRGAARKHPI